MKTLPLLLLGSALFLLLLPTLAHAEEPLPAPVAAAPARVYFTPARTTMPPAHGYMSERLVATERRSTRLMVGGIIVASLGTASLVGGVVLGQSPPHCSPGGFCGIDAEMNQLKSRFFVVSGGLAIAGGVAMIVAGSWQVPVRTGAPGSAPGALTVAVGPGNATLRLSF
jgi:hypothetical protein